MGLTLHLNLRVLRYHFIINGSDIAGADSPLRRHICKDGGGQVRSLDLPMRTVASCFAYIDRLHLYLQEGFILGWDIPWFVILFLLSIFVFFFGLEVFLVFLLFVVGLYIVFSILPKNK